MLTLFSSSRVSLARRVPFLIYVVLVCSGATGARLWILLISVAGAVRGASSKASRAGNPLFIACSWGRSRCGAALTCTLLAQHSPHFAVACSVCLSPRLIYFSRRDPVTV